jgi:Mg-chelatase subunit ChlD
MSEQKFNPLNPNQAAPAGSFAAKLAARQAKAAGQDTRALDVSELSPEEQAQLTKANDLSKAAEEFVFIAPEKATEVLDIVFDNSGSMSGQALTDAKDGVTEFMMACTPNETALRIVPLNNGDFALTKVTNTFTCDLPLIAGTVLDKIHAEGGTPLYKVIQDGMYPPVESEQQLKAKRMVVFSDGIPDGGESQMLDQTIQQAVANSVVLDTCLIAAAGRATESNSAYRIMKRLAEETGGVFLVFEKGKCDFKKGFKYLTKGNRKLLMDNNFKTALEEGRV